MTEARRLLDEIERFISDHGRDARYAEVVSALESARSQIESDPGQGGPESPGRRAARQASEGEGGRDDERGNFRGRVFAVAEHRQQERAVD